ncbi:MAG: aldolase/citrate lyase family protein [Dehalococcoidia bacterium]|jgi:2-keto-3-deoxy-L-rhamnonate aldolase RhmA|nr:aldolase/citrate lyase family protein [Dehalococcoidia bacterium]
MRNNYVRDKLRRREPSIGAFLGLESPNVAELFGHHGFEWLLIETEHNGLDAAEVETMVRAIETTEAIPLVRVPSHDQVPIQRALDIGALGVKVPMIRTADEAQEIVAFTRYPGAGVRSWGPMRATGYTAHESDYFQRVNENILVSLILETVEAVENLEEICSVPGIDAISLGPADLGAALGYDPLVRTHPDIEAVAGKMVEIGKKTGVAMGISARTQADIQMRLDQGFLMINYGADYALLAALASEGVETFRNVTSAD